MTNTGFRAALAFLFFTPLVLWGQTTRDTSLVQFTGIVLDGSTEQLYPVPYTNILIKEKNRGTYSDLRGFFSIVVQKGDIIIFSAIGYKDVYYHIPLDLKDDRYSIVQLMTQDTINLPETVVFPWPSRDHFKLEFLAMDVTPEMQERATANVANEALRRMRNEVPRDPAETAGFYLRQQSNQYYSIGQAPPMNIYNVAAWKRFFDAWKRGDFKKKTD